ncbi:MAG: arginine repressor [Gemmatimonadota bacterium]
MDQKDREARLSAIRRLIAERRVRSQEELARLLTTLGIRVSQSTLSRDIRELGLVKRAARGEKSYYAPPGGTAGRQAEALSRVLPDLLSQVDGSANLLVLKTLAGSAQPVAAALDHARWPEVIGTVAGDDTVLVVLRSPRQRAAVARRVRALARRR